MRYFTSVCYRELAVDVVYSSVLFPCSLAVVLPGKGGHCSSWVSGQVSATILCFNGCVLGADPYVLIKCENQKVRSSVQHNTTSAIFNTQVIFYRKNIDSPVIVQVRKTTLGWAAKDRG